MGGERGSWRRERKGVGEGREGELEKGEKGSWRMGREGVGEGRVEKREDIIKSDRLRYKAR